MLEERIVALEQQQKPLVLKHPVQSTNIPKQATTLPVKVTTEEARSKLHALYSGC